MPCYWASWDGARKMPLIEFFHQLGGHRFYPPDFCIVSQAAMALWRNQLLMTCWPPPRNGLVSTPLGMSCWCVFCEAANLPLPVVDQPADTFLWFMAVNKWLVFVRYHATIAKAETCWLIEPLNSSFICGKCGTVHVNIKLRINGSGSLVLIAYLFLALLFVWVLCWFLASTILWDNKHNLVSKFLAELLRGTIGVPAAVGLFDWI